MTTLELPCKTRPERWFPKRYDNAEAQVARNLCGVCPIRRKCLDDALDQADEHGIRAGLDPEQRKTILRRQGRPATAWEKDLADRRAKTVHLAEVCGWSVARIALKLGVTVNVVQDDIRAARKAATLAAYPTAEQRIAAARRGKQVWLDRAEKTVVLDILDDGTRTVATIAALLDASPSMVFNRRAARKRAAA